MVGGAGAAAPAPAPDVFGGAELVVEDGSPLLVTGKDFTDPGRTDAAAAAAAACC